MKIKTIFDNHINNNNIKSPEGKEIIQMNVRKY